MTSFLQPLLGKSSANCTLVNTRTGATVANQLIGAFDSVSRRTGLLHHGGLPPGTAMVIAPSNAVHTFFMKFPIDLAFVGRDGRVWKVREAVGPWRIAAAWRAYAVIELSAGVLRRTDTIAGDTLIIRADRSLRDRI